ncbi:unnamed protein product [Urochloa decumbens]|uniref:histidine kinase n=1 Tax=Urochloa decumbens TaxID=240449 RepID=A0ABC9ADM0_9POAL
MPRNIYTHARMSEWMAAAAGQDAVLLVRTARRCGGCDAREGAAVESLLQWQKVSDLLIAASLLSIPLELLYLATCAALAPLRRALLQLGAFIVACGVTHLLNALAYDRPGSRRLLAAITAAKAVGALATTAAAASLPVFFPRLLRVKARESLLRNKARRLDRDLAAARRREDAVWRVVRAVTRGAVGVDARAILRATMLQLSAALGLRDCAVWMPVAGACGVLQLAHRLLPPGEDDDKALDCAARAVSVRHPDVDAVLAGKDAMALRPGSVLATAGAAAAAIRIPNFHGASEPASYAILVLVRQANNGNDDNYRSPARWSGEDLEIVQAVADQVAVALSHAAALEEWQLIRREVAEQHGALLHARSELEAANRAMRDAVARPAHAVVGLVSVMQREAADAVLRPEQRLAVDAVARASAVASVMADSVMATVSTTTDAGGDPPPLSSSPSLVARRPFELHSLVRDAASVAGCLARCQGLGFSHQLEGSSLPEWVVGDDKRVFHLLLHMVGVVLSRCHRHVAGLSFSVCRCSNIVGDEQAKISAAANQVFVKFQVGLTRSAESRDPAGSVPASCMLPPSGHAPDYGSADVQLSIAVCKRIAQMMNGNMWWAASESEGLGETMTLLLRFQLQPPLNPHVPSSGGGTYRIGASPRTLPHHHHFNGLRILLADSDATSMEVTRKLLERLGCEVVPAPSAADCLSLLGGGAAEPPPFQLVVLDIDAAATMDGFEVALRIRELSNACWLLVLIAVAASGVDDRVRDMCRRAGVNGLIEKPVTLPALGAQLQRVLHNN